MPGAQMSGILLQGEAMLEVVQLNPQEEFREDREFTMEAVQLNLQEKLREDREFTRQVVQLNQQEDFARTTSSCWRWCS